ncbi:MAG: glycosyltransferase family 4 protein [Bacteroidota bacterium]|nr:glycosyltransferase family 4 protein [Bacteroidota bacterium]MDP3146601.1 glycosyltransferase family 4 protein [Bacteroidota bacterium]
MKLLILTQYFPPEVGAPQNRLFELAVRLQKLGVDITVLTAMPNYPQMEIYKGYADKKYVYEEMDGLKVHRASIFVSKSKSILNRLRNYFSFVISSAKVGKNKLGDFDFLLCESPPLFLGYSAMRLARQKNAKLIFNVSDLWPESAEKLDVVNNKFLLKLAYNLEEKLYKSSVLVTGQTQGICHNINQRFPSVKTYWLPNGVDLGYYNPTTVVNDDWRKKNNFSEEDIILVYAGIIGIAQGLEVILETAKNFKTKPTIKFVFIGSGPEKDKLIQHKKDLDLQNVFFLEAISKKEMPAVLKSCNAAIIPLRKLDLFLGAIPSKIFENLAMEIPILLGVDGEARQLFIDKGNAGLYFEPENSEELTNVIFKLIDDKEAALQLGRNGRRFVNDFFNREIIAQNFYNELKKL